MRVKTFDELLGRAYLVVDAEVGDIRAPTAGYSSAGNWVALHSHLLIAVWDGQAARGTGGTAEIVKAKLAGRYPQWNASDPLAYDEGGAIVHIVTARDGQSLPEHGEEPRWLYPETTPEDRVAAQRRFASVVRRIDEMNRLLGTWMNSRHVDDPRASNISHVMAFADTYAAHFQKRAHNATIFIAVMAIVAALVSLLQIVAGANAAKLFTLSTFGAKVLAVGAHAKIITIATIVLGLAAWAMEGRYGWQRLHGDLRVLAEGCRVQKAWAASGLGDCVADNYHPVQAAAISWIRRVIRTAHMLDTGEQRTTTSHGSSVELGVNWIDEQVEYFVGDKGVVRNYRRKESVARILGLLCLLSGLLLALTNASLGFLSDGAAVIGATFKETVRQLLLPFDAGHDWQLMRIGFAAFGLLQTYQTTMAWRDLRRSFAVTGHLFQAAAHEAHLALTKHDDKGLLHLIRQLGKAALVEQVGWLVLKRQRRVKPPGILSA